MNRTERLYALVEALRARAPRPVRAAELARRFEVSVRTIERDLAALQEAGVPVWSQPGPGGGYGLHAETTLPPLNLTPMEAVGVATALAASRGMPFPQAARSALTKLAGAMAAASRDTASGLVGRIRMARGPGGRVGPAAGAVWQALRDSVAVELSYRDAQDRETRRVVEPAGLFSTPHGWYLAAWCRLREAPRSFRLDRITRASLTDQPVMPRALDAVLPPFPYDLAQPVLT